MADRSTSGKRRKRGPKRATMYCLGCDYVLDGLASDRCPECGRGFDRSDVSTYALRPDQFEVRRVYVLACWLAGIHLIAMGLSAVPLFVSNYQVQEQLLFLMMPIALMDYPVMKLLSLGGFHLTVNPVMRFVLLLIAGSIFWFGIGLVISLVRRWVVIRLVARRVR